LVGILRREIKDSETLLQVYTANSSSSIASLQPIEKDEKKDRKKDDEKK